MVRIDSIRARLRRGQARACADELRDWLCHAAPDDPCRLEAMALRCRALEEIQCTGEELLAVAHDLTVAAQRLGNMQILARSHCHAAQAYRRLGIRGEASQHATEALRLAREAGHLALQSEALVVSSQLPLDTDDFAQASRLLRESLVCAEASGEPEAMFWPLNCMTHMLGVEAANHAAAGEHEASRAKVAELLVTVDRALALARASGHFLQEAYALSNLADAYIVEGDAARARELIAAYADLARRIDCGRLQAYAALDEVRLLRASGHRDDAIALLLSPALHQHLVGNPDLGRIRLRNLYELHKAQGRFDLALARHEELAEAQEALLSDQSASMQRVLLARLDLEQAQAAAERSRLEAQAQRLRAQAMEQERDVYRQASLRDPLTSLGNRRAADDEWHQHVERAAREGEEVFVAVIDVDEFKRVNDVFGHAAGDEVLIAIARILQDLLRRRDGLYRLGGEEFLAVMTDGAAASGLATCDRLRRGVAAVDWAAIAPGLHVTVSIGAARRRDGEGRAVLLERADAAMYAAKAAGRNRCAEC